MSNFRSRLLKSMAATALGPVVTGVFQVLTVPIYLHVWGPKLYGEWLILSAVPAYLSLTDFGFASVAGNTMTMDVARNQKDEALITFQSAWLLTSIIGCIMLTLVGCATLFPLNGWLKLTVLTGAQVKIIFVLLSIQVLVSLQSNMNQAGFKCDGNYAFGALSVNIVRLMEMLAISLGVLFHGSPVTVAALSMSTQAVGTIINRINLHRLSPWLKLGFKFAEWKRARDLFLPALAFMAYPIGDAIGLQGSTIAVGLVLGPLSVVIFSTLRTLTRVVIQAIRVIMFSVGPEMSVSYASGDWDTTRRLHSLGCRLSLWLSGFSVLILFFTGKSILRIWTHNRVPMDSYTYWSLLAIVVTTSVWHASSAVLISSNRHQRAAFVYLGMTAFSLVIAVLLMRWIKLPGVGVALLTTEIVYGGYAIGASLKMLNEPVLVWLRSILRFPVSLSSLRKANLTQTVS